MSSSRWSWPMSPEHSPEHRPATAVIAEDEPLLAAELQEALGLLWPELKIVAVAGDGVRALQAIDAHGAVGRVPRHQDAEDDRARGRPPDRRQGARRLRDRLRPARNPGVRGRRRRLRAEADPDGAPRGQRAAGQGAARHDAARHRRGTPSACRKGAGPARAPPPAMDQRVARQRRAHDHGRRHLLLQGRQQVHAGRRGGRRFA